MATNAKTGVQDRILKAALAIAGEEGWASTGLSAVAARAKADGLMARLFGGAER